MALKSWLASLQVDVTAVTPVQANIHAGSGCNGTKTADVTAVTDTDSGGALVTAVTAAQNQTLQDNPLIYKGCTAVTAVTCKTIDTEANAVNQPLSGELLTQQAPEPKRLFRQRGPWLTGRQALDATAYHLHHFNCHHCQAAGRGERYGRRCAAGLALWINYNGEDDSVTVT